MMKVFGFSLNNLSLFGLVLSIGIVVDDAIVVVENSSVICATGMTPKEAAHLTMDEVGGALVAIALVLCAVFVPAAFVTGITGQFYKQFALTIATATVISLIVSLTLSPALARPDPADRTRVEARTLASPGKSRSPAFGGVSTRASNNSLGLRRPDRRAAARGRADAGGSTPACCC